MSGDTSLNSVLIRIKYSPLTIRTAKGLQSLVTKLAYPSQSCMWLSCNIYLCVLFYLSFQDDWKDRWVESTAKGADQGKFEWTAGKFYGDADLDKGIQTSQDAKFYGISSKVDKPISNEGKTLVIQFTMKHEQNIDCGEGYMKLYPSDVDQKNLHGDSPYLIMFGRLK
ncbi:CALR [Mytilus coruscus]|uniref:CALR n=1 Tax=Mytilus coruscus TaxID=42192 RepID=A0A6J8DJL3_MYTCO|nr:CALR [Mytilus coruscus]